ncbi:killer cell lectin-like receptor subfamily B member 1B allele A [Pleurodeles waltl]|uniref:killer cell lectin-like receptor subfamily B member 1B allele A n=1 Tax=Pleurodeles waltl TaxID=8319 RepID=UPI0037099FCB
MEGEEGYTALQFDGSTKPENEEGYTALQFDGSTKPENEEGYTALQCKGRTKPEDEEGFTALQLKGKREPENRCEDVLRADQQSPRVQTPALWIIVFLTVLLIQTVVGSSVWIFRLHRENRNLKMNLNQREECDSTNRSEGAYPTPSCPLEWQQHGGKCYYFPQKTDEKNWSASHEDCSSRGSCLAVIEDKAELHYLTSVLTNQVWLGLFITPVGRHWTWVNGSMLNENVFHVTGPADEDQCGAVHRGFLESSRCVNSLYWICQKEAEISRSRV